MSLSALHGNRVEYNRRRGVSRVGNFVRGAYNAYRVARPIASYIGKRLRSQSAGPAARRRRANPVRFAVSGGDSGGMPKPIRHSGRKGNKSVKTLSQLKKKVMKMSKLVNCNNSVFNAFENDAFTLTSAINRCNYGSFTMIDAAAMETALASLPATTTIGSRAQVNATTTPQPNKWCIKTSSKFCIRNNYLHPLVLDAYIVKPKTASNSSPSTVIGTGLTAMAISAGIIDINTSFYPSHSKYFVDGWKTLRHEKVTLEAGAEIVLSHYETFRNYDTKYADINTQTYLPKYSRVLMLRIQGVCSHDVTTSTLVGISEAQVDIVMHRKVQIIYPGNLAPIQTVMNTIGLDAVLDDEVAAQGGIIHDEL